MPRPLIICAFLLLLSHCASELHRHSLAAYPDAVCNDGTPAAYYYAPATSVASNSTWIVYLQGGGMCYDQTSCSERCDAKATRCSSEGWADTRDEPAGLFTADDAPLREAHRVFVRYCTSDAHWGNTEACEWSGAPMQFRGRVVVRAVIDHLVTARGLGAALAAGDGTARHLLVFGGTSAGARGAMAHLDTLPTLLGAAAAANTRVVGMLDSPLWLDMGICADCDEIDASSAESLPEVTELAYAALNVSDDLLGASCLAAHAADDDITNVSPRRRCLVGAEEAQPPCR